MAKELGESFTEREIQEMVEEADQDSKLACYYFILALEVKSWTCLSNRVEACLYYQGHA